MTLAKLFELVAEQEIELASMDGQLLFRPVGSLTGELRTELEFHKRDLITILDGHSLTGVGSCDECETLLIGLPTFDGFINRVCPNCDRWFSCFPAMK